MITAEEAAKLSQQLFTKHLMDVEKAIVIAAEEGRRTIVYTNTDAKLLQEIKEHLIMLGYIVAYTPASELTYSHLTPGNLEIFRVAKFGIGCEDSRTGRIPPPYNNLLRQSR